MNNGRFGPVSIAFHAPTDNVDDVNGTHHLKVYHDARHSLQIRKALDLWSAKPVTAGPGATNKQARPLKGGHLLLVDHRNRPVLYC
jgi:hypothetical protein